MNETVNNTVEMTTEEKVVENATVNCENESVTPDIEQKLSFFARVKEFFRKFLVGLKRRPQNIAIFVYLIALVLFSFNLKKVALSTLYINTNPMGLAQFAIMLFSILGFVAMIGSYPKRQKPKYVMIALFVVMMAIIFVFEIVYKVKLSAGIDRHIADCAGDAAKINEFMTKYSYLYDVNGMTTAHLTVLGLSIVLFVAAPLIGKLLKLINTSVNVEYTTQMAEIEREDD